MEGNKEYDTQHRTLAINSTEYSTMLQNQVFPQTRS